MLILQCSPRHNGSCANIAQAFASGLAETMPPGQASKIQIIRLADLNIRPCIACDACARPPHHCRLDPVFASMQARLPDQREPLKNGSQDQGQKHEDHTNTNMPCMAGQNPAIKFVQTIDQAGWLLDQLAARQAILIVSPVYFYALPAMLKALIDRSQRFYHARPKDNPAPSFVALLAGRSRGKQLFSGSLLTMNYFLHALGRKIDDKRLLPGQDMIQDRKTGQQATIRQMEAMRCWGRQTAIRLEGKIFNLK